MMPPSPNHSKHSTAKSWTIRRATAGDQDSILRLNARNNPEVWPLTAADLTKLLSYHGHHLVAVDAHQNIVGYLLSFPRTSDYDDSEMQEFRRLISEPFIYICQVVIASEYRRHGIARAMYGAITEQARLTGIRSSCCDVNTDPPNPISLTFHHNLGFIQVGVAQASNGFAIALLAKNLE